MLWFRLALAYHFVQVIVCSNMRNTDSQQEQPLHSHNQVSTSIQRIWLLPLFYLDQCHFALSSSFGSRCREVPHAICGSAASFGPPVFPISINVLPSCCHVWAACIRSRTVVQLSSMLSANLNPCYDPYDRADSSALCVRVRLARRLQLGKPLSTLGRK